MIDNFIPPMYLMNWECIRDIELMKDYFQNQEIGFKTVADIVEALIGASYFT